MTGLVRASTLACPRCGSRRLFRHWLIMVDACPRCGLRFEQSDGYWLGSVALNLGVTEGTFLVAFVAGIVLTWPNVPWTVLLVVGVTVAVLLPVLFHPFSRTLWVAAERHVSGWRETARPTPVRVITRGE